MIFSDETYARLSALFKKRQIPITEAHREQCYMPDQATLLVNNRGTAPGMWFEKSEGKMLCSMPGVPHEMKYILQYGLLPKVRDQNQIIYRQKTIRTSGTGESILAEMVEPVLAKHPVKVAYLPAQGQVRLRLSMEGPKGSEINIEQSLQKAVAETVAIIEPHVFGYDDEVLEAHVGELLKNRDLTLGTAESCTGGHIAHLITSVSGASSYFRGSIIAYDNEIKEHVLAVRHQTLAKIWCGQ